MLVLAALLCLGAANIAARATWHEVEDGVLWIEQNGSVVAAEIAPGTPAARVGLKHGDVLLAIDNAAVEQVEDVVEALHGADRETTLHYTVLRLGATNQPIDVRLAPIPGGPGVLYFVLAAVGTFTLCVGGAVRLRRPRDPATLHFFWIAAAFFGVFTFSFSGRLDRLDWVFYWADAIAILALPPLFLHFTLVFPERPRRWSGGQFGRAVVVAAYVPAIVLGIARVIAIGLGRSDAALFARVISNLDRLELLYLALCFLGGAAPRTTTATRRHRRASKRLPETTRRRTAGRTAASNGRRRRTGAGSAMR